MRTKARFLVYDTPDPTNRAVGVANLIPVVAARHIVQVAPSRAAFLTLHGDMAHMDVAITVEAVESGSAPGLGGPVAKKPC